MDLSLDEIERRMRPGEFSQAGFLGWDESLADVLAQDARVLHELGITAVDLASALEDLLAAALSGDPPHDQREGYLVDIHLTPGFQICPFAPDPDHAQCTAGGGVRFGSVDWRIRNKRTGQHLKGPGLITHLIRAHGFFEGTGTPYRVDPAGLARLLELGPFARA